MAGLTSEPTGRSARQCQRGAQDQEEMSRRLPATLPTHRTPEQALAVFGILDELRDRFGNRTDRSSSRPCVRTGTPLASRPASQLTSQTCRFDHHALIGLVAGHDARMGATQNRTSNSRQNRALKAIFVRFQTDRRPALVIRNVRRKQQRHLL